MISPGRGEDKNCLKPPPRNIQPQNWDDATHHQLIEASEVVFQELPNAPLPQKDRWWFQPVFKHTGQLGNIIIIAKMMVIKCNQQLLYN